MRWPLSQDYNEAIQCPRGNFSDPDLQGSTAVTNPLGIPLPRSGNFADVYQLCCPGGGRWAVKCFTREVPGLRERYAAISRHLAQAKLLFFVDFTFLEQGIRVRGRWFPVLKMQWVDGLTLNEFVRENADQPRILDRMLQVWVCMAARLRQTAIAHADLQHGNVMLVPDLAANALALKLVDYDGMFVPALAGSASGETGHPCYQHPQRSAKRTYSLEVDRFPLLLIATALSCLKVCGKTLWDKYDSGDNLLFSEADFRSPVKSLLFHELLKLTDPQAKRLVWKTLDALKGRLESVPLLEEVLPEVHSSAAPKPAGATPPPNSRTETRSAAAPPTVEEQPADRSSWWKDKQNLGKLQEAADKQPATSSPSPGNFKDENKYRSRRWRMSCAALLLCGIAVAGLAAPVLVASLIFMLNATARFPIHERIGPWRIENDTLVVEHTGQNRNPHEIYFGDENWSDYDFTVEVKRIAGKSHCALLLSHPSRGNAFRVKFGDNDQVILEPVQNNPVMLLGRQLELQNDVWYPLTAKVRGSYISIELPDGKTIGRQLKTQPKGIVGLRVDSSTFAFRNIKMTHKDGRVLLQGLPDLAQESEAATDNK